MLRGRFESAADRSPEKLRSEYAQLLVDTIETVGPANVAAQPGVDRDTIESLRAGDTSPLTLAEAAAILATDETLPDAETIEAQARDLLLMGMSIAVVDVETIAAEIDVDLEPKEIQQKIEGRFPMTLEEYATVHQFIASRKR